MSKSTNWANRYRRLILWIGLGVIAAWWTTLLALYVVAPAIKSAIQDRAALVLEGQFGARVRFQQLDVSFRPRVHVQAAGVSIGDNPAAPLIQAATAVADCGWLPWHVRRLTLEGLSVRIPTGQAPSSLKPQKGPEIRIDEIQAEHSHAAVMPTNSQMPLRFEVGDLRVTNFSPSRAAEFSALITSAEPRADIQTHGRVGPWNARDPGLTPLEGSYRTSNCDLAKVPGLKGTLSSQGHFEGVIERIQLEGDAQAAQFGLSSIGNPEPLRANFLAVLDASDGSATVKTLDGTLASSWFSTSGLARNVQDDQLRDIVLDISIPKGRLEELLRLAIQATPAPLSGAVQMRAKLEIRAGEQDILSRVRLDGDFSATNARFSSLDLRERLQSVNRKPSGHSSGATPGGSVANIDGHLIVNHGSAEFSPLVVTMEEASSRLEGSYQLANGKLDLHGELWMAGKLSQTATGMKAFLMKAADPFFRKKSGGSQVPIKITGTRADPKFSLDIGK